MNQNTTHLDPDRLADLHEGLLDPAETSAAEQHLAGCAACSADLDAIAGVPDVLAGAAEVGPMPEDVVRRIDRALTDAAAAPYSGTATRTVTPLPDRRGSSPRGMRILQAAAVIVLLLAGGALGISALGGGGDDETATSGSAAGKVADEAGNRVPITASGRNWTKPELAAAGPAFARGTVGPPVALYSRSKDSGRAQGGTGESTPAPAAGAPDSAASRLREPGAITACSRNLTGRDTAPRSVDLAKFEGQPAAVFAFPTPGDLSRVDLFVVAPDCPTGTFLYYASVPRS